MQEVYYDPRQQYPEDEAFEYDDEYFDGGVQHQYSNGCIPQFQQQQQPGSVAPTVMLAQDSNGLSSDDMFREPSITEEPMPSPFPPPPNAKRSASGASPARSVCRRLRSQDWSRERRSP